MKVFTASPLPLSQDSWTRDITVLYRGFESLGHEAACIRLHSKDGAAFPGILQVSPEEMVSPSWWKAQRCDLVVANTWGVPRHTPMIQAIKASGARLLIRMDSDGYNSPRNGFWRYFKISQSIQKAKHGPAKATVLSAVKSLLFAVPSVYDHRMLSHLSIADVVGIESEGAYRLFVRLLESYRRMDLVERLRVIRHPVVPEIEATRIPSLEEREKRIVCVGRWDSPQKDAPLLVKALGASLVENREWRAELFGCGQEVLDGLLRGLPQDVADRIIVKGPRPHEEILESYSQSRLSLITSVYESGPISAEEALCFGCTIVGPPDVPSMHDLAEPSFGTLSGSRNPSAMVGAIRAEIDKWKAGNRLPHVIAARARSRFSAKSICKEVLTAVEAISPLLNGKQIVAR